MSHILIWLVPYGTYYVILQEKGNQLEDKASNAAQSAKESIQGVLNKLITMMHCWVINTLHFWVINIWLSVIRLVTWTFSWDSLFVWVGNFMYVIGWSADASLCTRSSRCSEECNWHEQMSWRASSLDLEFLLSFGHFIDFAFLM